MNLNGLERINYFKKDWQEKIPSKRSIFFWLIFLIIIGLVGYFFIFQKQIFKKEKSVSLKIEGPDEISIGQEFITKITIFNQENSDLTNLELSINFPENFYFISSSPSVSQLFSKSCLINLFKIKKEEKKEVIIKGKIFGMPEEKRNFVVTLHFQLENFSAWFKKEKSKEIVLKSYPLDLEIYSPEELLNGEEGEFKIRIKNSLDNQIKTKIVLSFPSDFEFSFFESEAENEDGKKIWFFDLDGFKEKDINFKGLFSSSSFEDKKFKLEIGLIDEKKNFFLQKEKEFLVKLTQPGLVLGLRINDSFLEEQNANFNDEISFILNYKNIAKEDILNLNLKLLITQPEFLSLEKISDSFWIWQSEDKKIESNQWKIETIDKNTYLFWDKSQIKNFEIIKPGQEGEIYFSLKIKPYEEIFKIRPINPFSEFSLISEASIFRIQKIIFKSESNKIKLKINTKVKLEIEARYFDDQGLKIGFGPLPPRVGETTSYIVFLRPVNTTNEIKDIRIETKLTEKTTWLGEEKTSIGNLSFDNFSKKIVWQINSILPYSGGPYSFLEASFRIGLTPTEEDKGKILTLLEKTNFEAQDSFTGVKIYIEAKPIDTDLKSDDLARGKGIIE